MRVDGGLYQERRDVGYRSIGKGRSFGTGKRLNEIGVGARRLKLVNLVIARNRGKSAIVDDADQTIIRNSCRQPCHELGRSNRLGIAAVGGKYHPKKEYGN